MKKLPALFIGRWQPFHEGHKKLIETVLKEGQDVIIAVRETPASRDNPYNVAEREIRIKEALKEWGERVRTIWLPDIGSVCYGRDVGYEVRRIRLDPETEEISATSLRRMLRENL